MKFTEFLDKDLFNFMSIKQSIIVLLIIIVTAAISFSTEQTLWFKISPVLGMFAVSLMIVWGLNFGPIIVWGEQQ